MYFYYSSKRLEQEQPRLETSWCHRAHRQSFVNRIGNKNGNWLSWDLLHLSVEDCFCFPGSHFKPRDRWRDKEGSMKQETEMIIPSIWPKEFQNTWDSFSSPPQFCAISKAPYRLLYWKNIQICFQNMNTKYNIQYVKEFIEN